MVEDEEQEKDFEPVSITLPERYWVVVLGLLDKAVAEIVDPRVQELRRQGASVKDLGPGDSGVLVGIVTARAQVVDKLLERGVLREEVRDKLGLEEFYSRIEEANQQAKKKREDES